MILTKYCYHLWHIQFNKLFLKSLSYLTWNIHTRKTCLTIVRLNYMSAEVPNTCYSICARHTSLCYTPSLLHCRGRGLCLLRPFTTACVHARIRQHLLSVGSVYLAVETIVFQLFQFQELVENRRILLPHEHSWFPNNSNSRVLCWHVPGLSYRVITRKWYVYISWWLIVNYEGNSPFPCGESLVVRKPYSYDMLRRKRILHQQW